MTVKELIEALQRMPQDSEVVMFDGQNRYTPRRDMWPTGKVMVSSGAL